MFIASIYDLTDGTNDAPSVPLNGKPGYFLPWSELSNVIDYVNKNIIKKFVESKHLNTFYVDMHKIMLGHGLKALKNNDEDNYWYLQIIEDPTPEGNLEIGKEFEKVILKNVPS